MSNRLYFFFLFFAFFLLCKLLLHLCALPLLSLSSISLYHHLFFTSHPSLNPLLVHLPSFHSLSCYRHTPFLFIPFLLLPPICLLFFFLLALFVFLHLSIPSPMLYISSLPFLLLRLPFIRRFCLFAFNSCVSSPPFDFSSSCWNLYDVAARLFVWLSFSMLHANGKHCAFRRSSAKTALH